MHEDSRDRKFLHDIATPIAGLKLIVRKVLQEMISDHPQMTKEQIIDRLEKCSELVRQLEHMHADFKDQITKI